MKHYIKPITILNNFTFEETFIQIPDEALNFKGVLNFGLKDEAVNSLDEVYTAFATNGFFEVPADFDRFDLNQVETIRHNVSEHFYTNYINQIKNNLK